ncbi:MAG: helix-turn-helix transcriptional regulator [Bryobacterales bacterium]|nr:helix-turn-helix transcriptional regulator [Bryobacterales bacterium]
MDYGATVLGRPAKETLRRGIAPSQDHITEEGGQKLRRARERLGLRYRDVEEASLRIAERHGHPEFAVALSRLADIENKGTVPTIYRLYSLCAIYRLDPQEVLRWYGVDLANLGADSLQAEIERTHLIGFNLPDDSEVQAPLSLDPAFDVRRTTYLSRMIQRWGTLPLGLLKGLDLKNQRYGYIGTEDWSMYPLLPPGSLVLVDEARRKVIDGGWESEFERPIYFLEYREGYACSWCQLSKNRLVLQPHPASRCAAHIYAYPSEIEVVGQVVGAATRLGPGRRRRARP